MLITKDSINQSVNIRIIDSGDGTPETGVVWNTAGIDLWYRREGAVSTDITEATLAALTTAHTDGGFLHINDGWYRLDVPDAAFATGVDGVQIGGTVTGMVVLAPYVQLTDIDLFDSVRGGMTALPNAAADAPGGLPISDAGGLDLDTQLAATNEVTAARMGALTDWINGGRLDLILDAIQADTNELQTDWANGGRLDTILDATALEATVAALNDISAADVNAQCVDVLATDTLGDPAQGAPPLNVSTRLAISYLYRQLVRNRVVVDTNTANQIQVFADDETTILYENDITNAANVTTKAEAISGA